LHSFPFNKIKIDQSFVRDLLTNKESMSIVRAVTGLGGAPATFTPEVICQIMALACEDPETLDVPISHWSQSELARQSVARGIVKSISHGSVGRFLKKRPISSRIATVTG
jgi:hypothetical protein